MPRIYKVVGPTTNKSINPNKETKVSAPKPQKEEKKETKPGAASQQ